MPRRGLEPPRYHYHWHLKPARLPIPPPGHGGMKGEECTDCLPGCQTTRRARRRAAPLARRLRFAHDRSISLPLLEKARLVPQRAPTTPERAERRYTHQIPSRDEISAAMEKAGKPLTLEALAPRFEIRTEQHRRALEARHQGDGARRPAAAQSRARVLPHASLSISSRATCRRTATASAFCGPTTAAPTCISPRAK